MEAGFRDRALAVEALLAAPETGFVLVTSPRRDAMEEAQFFARQLEGNGQPIDALIVNRVHPEFGDEAPAGLRAAAAELRNAKSDRAADRPAAERLAVRYENLANFREIAELERAHVRGRAGAGRRDVDLLRALPLPRRVRLRRATRDRRVPLRRARSSVRQTQARI